jgi:hypothetical protein
VRLLHPGRRIHLVVEPIKNLFFFTPGGGERPVRTVEKVMMVVMVVPAIATVVVTEKRHISLSLIFVCDLTAFKTKEREREREREGNARAAAFFIVLEVFSQTSFYEFFLLIF